MMLSKNGNSRVFYMIFR